MRFLIFNFIIGILQSIDMITSLYENNFPMRFGVILYSSKFVKQIEINSDSSAKENDGQNEEDISSLVIIFFYYSYCLSVLHFLRVSYCVCRLQIVLYIIYIF